jgi:glycerol-3-phosphate dehydrogenase (NAD(P)+)
MNMVAEGHNASKCMQMVNKNIQADIPIADIIYKILWENLSAREGFAKIEQILI